MTLERLQWALMGECPGGISFEPMAMRLWKGKLAKITDGQIGQLKEKMFRRSDGIWLFAEQVADDSIRREIEGFADVCLRKAGYVTLPTLGMTFAGRLKLLHSPEDCVAFFTHCFRDPPWSLSREQGVVALQRHSSAEPLLALLKRDTARVSSMIDDAGGVLPRYDALAELSHLDEGSLTEIMKRLVPDVCMIDVDGIPCWQRIGAIHLPDDFSEKVTHIMDLLLELDFKVTPDNVNLALSMTYDVDFRKEYAQNNDALFRRIVETNYRGTNTFGWKYGTRLLGTVGHNVPRFPLGKSNGKQSEIIGLKGMPLARGTWKAHLLFWKDLRRKTIADMKSKGATNIEIAKRLKCTESYVRSSFEVHRRMPKIFEINGMTEEDL